MAHALAAYQEQPVWPTPPRPANTFVGSGSGNRLPKSVNATRPTVWVTKSRPRWVPKSVPNGHQKMDHSIYHSVNGSVTDRRIGPVSRRLIALVDGYHKKVPSLSSGSGSVPNALLSALSNSLSNSSRTSIHRSPTGSNLYLRELLLRCLLRPSSKERKPSSSSASVMLSR